MTAELKPYESAGAQAGGDLIGLVGGGVSAPLAPVNRDHATNAVSLVAAL